MINVPAEISMPHYVYEVWKVYPSSNWLVGYFRTEASAQSELDYLKRYENDAHTSVSIKKVFSTDVPLYVFVKWDKEDRLRKLLEDVDRTPLSIALPMVSKPFPNLFNL